MKGKAAASNSAMAAEAQGKATTGAGEGAVCEEITTLAEEIAAKACTCGRIAATLFFLLPGHGRGGIR